MIDYSEKNVIFSICDVFGEKKLFILLICRKKFGVTSSRESVIQRNEGIKMTQYNYVGRWL